MLLHIFPKYLREFPPGCPPPAIVHCIRRWALIRPGMNISDDITLLGVVRTVATLPKDAS